MAVTAPVPRPPHHLSGDVATAEWHSRATLGLRPDLSSSHWSLAGNPRRTFHSPHPTAGFTYCRSLRARSPFTRPCRSFCCAYAELIRDQTPPTDFCNQRFVSDVRATQPGPLILAGTETAISFLFLRAEPPRERRRAASRAPSIRANLGVGSSRLPEFARPRCRLERATSSDFRRASVVTIDVHGSVDRVKDVIRPNARGSSPSISGAYAFLAHADAVPLLGNHRTPFVPGASVGRGGTRYRLSTTGLGPCSNDAPRRAPFSPGPGCLSPSPVSPRRQEDDYSSLLFRVGLPLTPPPLFPQAGESVEWGLASTTERSPVSAASSFDFGSANAFVARWNARAWD